MIILALGLIVSIIDSAFGMLYGTILSPLLLLFYSPSISIPAILLSQGLGGVVAGIRHHKYSHISFKIDKDSDIRSILLIVIPGILAIILGVILVIKLNPMYIKAYTSVLIISIGVMLIADKKMIFSNKKMFLIGFISAFNKVVSGGGFGPIVTGGQISIGVSSKRAIAIEAFSKAPICLIGFLIYFFTKGITDFNLIIYLSIGAMLGSLIGPKITKLGNSHIITKILGFIIIIQGILLILSMLGVIHISI